MIPEAFVVHKTANRIRLKIPSQKGNASFFNELQESLKDVANIEFLQTKALTGSLLIVHSSDLPSLVDAMNKKGLFRVTLSDPRKTKLHSKIEETFTDIDKKITKVTSGELNLAMVLFLALTGTALFQVARGNFNAIPWYTALWYAASLFKKAKHTE